MAGRMTYPPATRAGAIANGTGGTGPWLRTGRLSDPTRVMSGARRAWLRDREVFVRLVDGSRVSERELARQASLGHATVNHLVTGRRSSCSVATAHAISRVLGAPAARLFLL